jgi:hypothetical protein
LSDASIAAYLMQILVRRISRRLREPHSRDDEVPGEDGQDVETKSVLECMISGKPTPNAAAEQLCRTIAAAPATANFRARSLLNRLSSAITQSPWLLHPQHVPVTSLLLGARIRRNIASPPSRSHRRTVERSRRSP